MNDVEERPVPVWIHGAFGVLAVVLFGLGAHLSWGRWADVQIDFGRELYVPWRMVEGDVLYRDLAWFNGPLSPHLNAMLFRVFGVGYWTLCWANLVLLGVACFVMHRVVARGMGAIAGWLGVLLFLGMFAFPHLVSIGNYNWVSPYSHEMTHGVLGSLIALWMLGAALEGKHRARSAALGGLALGCVFLTKAEIFLAADVACGALVLLSWIKSEASERIPLKPLLLGFAAPVLLAGIGLVISLGFGAGMTALAGSWPGILSGEAAELAFYRRGMGLDVPAEHLKAMGQWGGGLLGIYLLGWVLEIVVPRKQGLRVVVAALLAGGVAALLRYGLDLRWSRAAHPLPIVAGLGVIVATLGSLRSGDAAIRRRRAAEVGFGVFALVLLAKMILNTRVEHYGFALALPAGVYGIALLCVRWPEALGFGKRKGPLLGAAAFGVFLAAGLEYRDTSARYYHRKVHPVGEGRDRMLGDGRAQVIATTLNLLEGMVPKNESLLVLPEGVTINYWSRRKSPTPYINFMPPELILFGEDRMIRALEANPPSGVLLVHKPTHEYGFPFFGSHYGSDLARWIQERYRPLGPPLGDGYPLQPGTRFGVLPLTSRR